ncbi:MAG: hypothetical protein KH020_15130 [Clostridiales bacterium]|nr:hypothetical protein [Clostridiales bacterium]
MERQKTDMNVLMHGLVISQIDKSAKENKGKLLYQEKGKTKYLIIDILEICILVIIDGLCYLYINNMHWVNILAMLFIGIIYAFRIHYHYNCSKSFVEIYQNYVLAQGMKASWNDGLVVSKHELLQIGGAASTIRGYQICEYKNGRKEIVIVFAEKNSNKYKNQIILEKLNGEYIMSALHMVDVKQL